jgi:four helix bundle protein
MKDYRKLNVWVRTHARTLALYEHSAKFPRSETYGLTSQLRRAASSIGANIAEGCGRGTDGDMRRFFKIAMGSATETDYDLVLARDLGFIASDVCLALVTEIAEIEKMLTAFILRLRPVPGRYMP